MCIYNWSYVIQIIEAYFHCVLLKKIYATNWFLGNAVLVVLEMSYQYLFNPFWEKVGLKYVIL